MGFYFSAFFTETIVNYDAIMGIMLNFFYQQHLQFVHFCQVASGIRAKFLPAPFSQKLEENNKTLLCLAVSEACWTCASRGVW